MEKKFYSVISGSGRYLPEHIVKNIDFLKNTFFDNQGKKIDLPNEEIIEKFRKITEIDERRYVNDDQVTSDIGYFAAKDALESSGTDKESLDYIIVAHNFGDIKQSDHKSDIVPTIAARIKNKLQIRNPMTVAYDITFGCPGWLQGVIQADYYIRSGDARKIMVIGAETLSRVCDPGDRDSMLYSDGAGAVILEAAESESPVGIIAHAARTDSLTQAYFLKMGHSNDTEEPESNLFLKMEGRKLYEYALSTVPQMVKDCLDKARLALQDIKKVLFHQANTKMNDAMIKQLFRLFGFNTVPDGIMPMTISNLGNNSVATLPIMLDLILKGDFLNHRINQGDYVVFASVGAGMSANTMIYKAQ